MSRNLVKTQTKITKTRSQNFTAIHRSSRKLRGGLDVVEYMLKCMFC